MTEETPVGPATTKDMIATFIASQIKHLPVAGETVPINAYRQTAAEDQIRYAAAVNVTALPVRNFSAFLSQWFILPIRCSITSMAKMKGLKEEQYSNASTSRSTRLPAITTAFPANAGTARAGKDKEI